MSTIDTEPSLEFYSDEHESAVWIVTFADLMTLLLVFFILLYSISTLNMQKFKYAIESIQQSLGENHPEVGILKLADLPETRSQDIVIEDLTGLRSREQEMLESINEFIADKDQDENILVHAKDGKIIIEVRGQILFASGAAVFSDAAQPIMDEIANIVQAYPEYNANIKGHTDDIPISTPQFPSNWELSAVRATTVLQYLLHKGVDPYRLTATGYGERMPLVPNDSPENRATNRRVEFVLEKKNR
jgi:chemotaxis protein MotB